MFFVHEFETLILPNIAALSDEQCGQLRRFVRRGGKLIATHDVTVWRQKSSMTVHLVNLTNPMMMKGPIREFTPVGKQRVRVRIPENKKPKRVKLLAAKTAIDAEFNGGVLEFVAPGVLDHEVVAIDL